MRSKKGIDTIFKVFIMIVIILGIAFIPFYFLYFAPKIETMRLETQKEFQQTEKEAPLNSCLRQANKEAEDYKERNPNSCKMVTEKVQEIGPVRFKESQKMVCDETYNQLQREAQPAIQECHKKYPQ